MAAVCEDGLNDLTGPLGVLLQTTHTRIVDTATTATIPGTTMHIHPPAAIMLGIMLITLGLTVIAWMAAVAINHQGAAALDDELFYRAVAELEQETDHV